MTLPKWTRDMARNKRTDDYIITSLHDERTVQAVRHAFCVEAIAGDLICVTIIKRAECKGMGCLMEPSDKKRGNKGPYICMKCGRKSPGFMGRKAKD